MKKIFLSLLILVTGSQSLSAQDKMMFSGEVRDAGNSPLEFANALAIDTVSQTMAAFAVTNSQGQFKLGLTKGKVYNIKISFVGFLPFEKIYTADESNSIPFLIQLSVDALQLSGVEIVSDMPVMIQGDTITYKAEVFTQGNERKLEDVLEDLPGFEVDDEGGVKIQGKSVEKVLVDGKEFFEGDTKLATKNLPANVVDKVQVLQNYNEIGPLNGVNNNSDRIALNIQLKDDKKNIVFGDLTAGGGPEERYLGHANSFFYNKKTNINLIADINNIGEPAFTMRDYFRFASGLGSLSTTSGSAFQVSSNQLGIPLAERDNAKDLNNKLAALNFNLTPKPAWRFSGFAIGSTVDNTLGSISNRTYILQPGNNEEVLSSEQNVNSKSLLAKLGITYNPNLNLQVDYNIFGRTANIVNTDLQNSVFASQTSDISGNRSQQPYSIEQQLRSFYAPNENDVFSIEASYKYQFQNPTYSLGNTNQPYQSIIPLSGTSPFNLTQTSETLTKTQESRINYYRILNKTNHINLSIGNIFTTQNLNSGIFETLQNGTINPFNDPSLVNLTDFSFKDIYAGILYKTKLGDLELRPSAYFHYYESVNTQNNNKEVFKKNLLLPSFYAKYSITNSHSLSFDYKVAAEFTDIQNLSSGVMIRGYNSLFAGSFDLKNSIYHNASLNYFNFNMYNFFNIYGSVNYSRRLNDVTNIVQFNNLERINSPVNINAVNEVTSASISADKRFDNFRLSVKGDWSRSISNNIISDTPNSNINNMSAYTSTFSTTLFKSIYVDLRYEVSFRNYEGRNSQGSFTNHRPSGSIEFDFLKSFTFEAEYEYNRYIAVDNIRTFGLLDSELRFRKDGSAWEFKVQGMNLLNTVGIRQDSFNESLISTFEYFIQKRYALFSVMYDL